MAIALSRARRDVDLTQHTTPCGVGPGSYETDITSFKPKYGYAPFSSTAERKMGVIPNETAPGPGAYSVASKTEIDRLHATNPVGAVLHSKTKRFHAVESSGPGPAAYSPRIPKGRSGFLMGKRSITGKAERQGPPAGKITWVRAHTAPSIPSRLQSQGYEEDEVGRLVLQPPPKPLEESPGPGAYKLPDSIGKAKFAPDIGKGAGRKPLVHVEGGLPGPGSYILAPPSMSKDEEQRPSHQFASRAPRMPRVVTRDKITPGPGDYDIQDSPRKRAPPPELQFFGSTSRRSMVVSRDAASLPGPGAYNLDRRFGAQKRSVNLHGAFGNTAVRFVRPSTAPTSTSVAPPTKFRRQVGAEKPRRRQKKKSGGVSFGSTSVRFAKPKHKELGPGPGSYDIKETATKRSAGSGAFRSKSKRISSWYDGKGSGVPANKYDVAKAHDSLKPRSHLHSTRSAFLCSARRDRQDRIAVGPGPGSYNVQLPKKMSIVRSFGSGGKRFEDQKQSQVPGPGHYGYASDPHASLVKKTHNVTIGDWD